MGTCSVVSNNTYPFPLIYDINQSNECANYRVQYEDTITTKKEIIYESDETLPLIKGSKFDTGNDIFTLEEVIYSANGVEACFYEHDFDKTNNNRNAAQEEADKLNAEVKLKLKQKEIKSEPIKNKTLKERICRWFN